MPPPGAAKSFARLWEAKMTKQPSLDQQRAAYAWQKVQALHPNIKSEYGKLAKGAPALIMNNGLMQTLAFYQDKKGDHYKELNQHIIDWLWKRRPRRDEGVAPTFALMMDELVHEPDSYKYRKATEETLALLRWIRQLAAINQ
ncbi:MAG: type III-B CRISPR module-associated protein Cmr5 [Methylobacter sp.]|nr:MAG: type III-B CRISPR module-associated protein Cmr5 [Methylobacter sp.]